VTLQRLLTDNKSKSKNTVLHQTISSQNLQLNQTDQSTARTNLKDLQRTLPSERTIKHLDSNFKQPSKPLNNKGREISTASKVIPNIRGTLRSMTARTDKLGLLTHSPDSLSQTELLTRSIQTTSRREMQNKILQRLNLGLSTETNKFRGVLTSEDEYDSHSKSVFLTKQPLTKIPNSLSAYEKNLSISKGELSTTSRTIDGHKEDSTFLRLNLDQINEITVNLFHIVLRSSAEKSKREP